MKVKELKYGRVTIRPENYGFDIWLTLRVRELEKLLVTVKDRPIVMFSKMDYNWGTRDCESETSYKVQEFQVDGPNPEDWASLRKKVEQFLVELFEELNAVDVAVESAKQARLAALMPRFPDEM